MLSDPERRGTYDAFGHEGLRSGGWAPRADGFGSFEDVLRRSSAAATRCSATCSGSAAAGPAGGGDVAAQVELSSRRC